MGQLSSIVCYSTNTKNNNEPKKYNNNSISKNKEKIITKEPIFDRKKEMSSVATLNNTNFNKISTNLDLPNNDTSSSIGSSDDANSGSFDPLGNKKRQNTSFGTSDLEVSSNNDIMLKRKHKGGNIINDDTPNKRNSVGANIMNDGSVILNENEYSDLDEDEDLEKEKKDAYVYENDIVSTNNEGHEVDASSVDTFITTENDISTNNKVETDAFHQKITPNCHDVIFTTTTSCTVSTRDGSSPQSSSVNLSGENSNIITQVSSNGDQKHQINLHNNEDSENNKFINGDYIDLSKLQINQEAAAGFETLLAPKDIKQFGRKKCIILDLDETLVHSSFKYVDTADFVIPVTIDNQTHHVYVIKRPGVDEFLEKVSKLYEVVVFTASVSRYGDPLLDILDPNNDRIHHRLFRESCYIYEGNYVKNLSQIGRPLNEIIILDNSPASYIFHPQHAVPISSWFSDAHDNELLDILPLLNNLANFDVPNVGTILDVTI